MFYDKYKLIEESHESIMDSYDFHIHVVGYDWLKRNLVERVDVSTKEYQKAYRSFWAMQHVAVESEFSQEYFKYLNKYKNSSILNLSETFKSLSDLKTNAKSHKGFQFSFISKLCHMIDSTSPIYDDMVRKFYKFPVLSSFSVEERREKALERMKDIRGKYLEILVKNLLFYSIKKFRDKYPDSQFSDVKIIDSLIWSYQKRQEEASPGN